MVKQNTTNEKSKKNILFGTILGYVALLVSIVSGLIYTPWVIDTLGKSNYAVFTLTNSIISMFLLDFGLGSASNRWLSKYKASEEQEKAEAFLGIIYKSYLFIDLLIFIAFVCAFFLIDYIYVGLSINERTSLKEAFVIAGGFSVIAFPAAPLSSVMIANEKFVIQKSLEIFHKLCYVTFSAISLVFGWGIIGLVLVNSLSSLVLIIFRYFFVKFGLKYKANFKEPLKWTTLRPILAFSVWAIVGSLTTRILYSVMPSILGIVSDSSNIAVFGVVTSLESYLFSIGSVITSMFFPTVARIFKSCTDPNERGQKITRLATKIGKIQFALLGLIAIGFACCGKQFILCWLNGDTSYLPAYICFILISIYMVLYNPMIIFENSIDFTSKIKYKSIAGLVSLVVNIVLAFLLGYFWGAIGISVSILISQLALVAADILIYRKILVVNIGSYLRGVYLKMLVPCIAGLLIGILLYFFNPLSGWIEVITDVAAISIVYIVFTIFYGYGLSESKKLFKIMFSRIGNKNKK